MAGLDGKVILVTGAADGLGAADARLMADRGATVVLTDVDGDKGRATASSLPGALFLDLDVRDSDGWARVMGEIRTRFGRLDGLVNNAGLVRFGTVETLSIDDFRLQQAVMSEGVFLGCRHAIPLMAASGGASIVNIASVAAVRGSPDVIGYAAAKGAVIAMTRALVVHCQDRGYPIRTNVILPGSHATKMADAAFAALPPAVLEGIRATQGQPADVAELVCFLCSDAAGTINGAEIVIDNGRIVR